MTTLSKTILEEQTIPRVDIDFMNNTHFEEIALVKNLGEHIDQYQNNDTHTDDETALITELLENWLQHTQAHFTRENELMKATQFPAYPIHSNEHEVALGNMTDVVKNWKRGHDIELLADYVFSTWPKWFNSHVDTMDLMTARYAVMNGFDPQSQPST